jgi:hypothetical protein
MLPLLLALCLLLAAAPTWAAPIIGYLEGTAENGWGGNYAVQLADGSTVSGVQQMAGGFTTLPTLPLTTTGCPAGSSCVLVTNLTTSTSFTMSFLGLALDGSATLGSLGTLSWNPQIVRLLPGDPSPTAAVLANATGLGLKPSTFSFGFNSTLTTVYSAVNGGQKLSALRLDFTDGLAPLTSRKLLESGITPDGTPGASVFINNGVPVALGTPLTATVPEPSSVVFVASGLMGLALFGGLTLCNEMNRRS